MPIRVFRTCESCGFDKAETGHDCPLCGASAVTLAGPSEAPTLAAGRTTLAEFDPSGRAIFGDRYRVEQLLGRGGMGDVYRVHDLVSGRDLALKVLRRSAANEALGLERFRREIAVLMKLRHPAVLSIVDHGVENGAFFFVSEIVRGEDLRATLRRRGLFPVVDAVALVSVVADALSAVHAEGVVHRDVKPANIMLEDEGAVRLVDFGLARPEGIDMERVTMTGEFVGTPSYMSPEQFDARTVDARSDIYSLGVVLFEILTGHVPFTGSSVLSMATKHLKDPPPAPSTSRPDLPTWVDRLVLKCLEKEPSRRFASAAALAQELRLPRTAATARPRRLPTGDSVVLAESAAATFALVLASPTEKLGWGIGAALRFEDRLYQLTRVDAPAVRHGLWTYRFILWPEGQIMRRLVDYESDASSQASPVARRPR